MEQTRYTLGQLCTRSSHHVRVSDGALVCMKCFGRSRMTPVGKRVWLQTECPGHWSEAFLPSDCHRPPHPSHQVRWALRRSKLMCTVCFSTPGKARGAALTRPCPRTGRGDLVLSSSSDDELELVDYPVQLPGTGHTDAPEAASGSSPSAGPRGLASGGPNSGPRAPSQRHRILGGAFDDSQGELIEED